MGEIAISSTYLHSGATKIWGAGVIRLSPALFSYASAWGPFGGTLQHKIHQPTSDSGAYKRYNGETFKKVQDGYSLYGLPQMELRFAAMAANAPGLSLSPSSSPDTVPGCFFCMIKVANYPDGEFLYEKCSLCTRPAGEHRSGHRHNLVGCEQFSMQPDRWSKYIDFTPHPGKVRTPKTSGDNCVMCAHLQAPLSDPFWETRCLCGLAAIAHDILSHPHATNTLDHSPCVGFVSEGNLAAIRAVLDTEKNAETSEVLADLPCDCRHHLNAHMPYLADDELPRRCLVTGCECSYYRRTCRECRVVTRTQWRHASSCKQGLLERLDAEPIMDVKQFTPTERRQRNLGDSLSDLY